MPSLDYATRHKRQPGYTTLQKQTIEKLKQRDFDGLTQTRITNTFKKILKDPNPKMKEELLDSFVQYEVLKNPKIGNTEDSIKFLLSKLKGKEKDLFYETLENIDFDIEKDYKASDQFKPRAIEENLKGAPKIGERDLGKLLEAKDEIDKFSGGVEKSSQGVRGDSQINIIEQIIGAKNEVSRTAAKGKAASNEGKGNGFFTDMLFGEIPELGAIQAVSDGVGLGFTDKDLATLDKMMSDDLKERGSVSNSDAWKVIGKTIFNPKQWGNIFKKRATSWGKEKLEDMKNFYNRIYSTFHEKEISAKTSAVLDQARAIASGRVPDDSPEEISKKKLRSQLGGTGYQNIIKPSRPKDWAIDGPVLETGGGPSDVGWEAKPETKLHTRGGQLAKQAQSWAMDVMTKMRDSSKYAEARNTIWDQDAVNDYFDIYDKLGDLNEDSSYGEFAELLQQLVGKTPDVYLGGEKTDDDVLSKIGANSGVLQKAINDGRMKVATSSSSSSSEKGDNRVEAKNGEEEEEDADPDHPDHPNSEEETKAAAYGQKHISILEASELRPKLELGGEEMLLNTPAETKRTEDVWQRMSVVPEGFGEGGRNDNKLFRRNLQSDNLRFGNTITIPGPKPEIPYPRPDARFMPLMQNVYQAQLPSGFPDNGQGYSNHIGMVDAYSHQPWSRVSPYFPQTPFPLQYQRQNYNENDQYAGDIARDKNIQIPVVKAPSMDVLTPMPMFTENMLPQYRAMLRRRRK